MTPRPRTTAGRIATLAAALAFTACGGDDDPPYGPTPGSIEVSVSTTGAEPDPDGYTVSVGADDRAVGTNEAVTFVDLGAGTYPVELQDVASNCVVAGENPRDIVVTGGMTTRTDFEVSCPPAVAAADGVRDAGEWDGGT